MSGINSFKLEFPNRRELARVYYPFTSALKFLPVLTIQSQNYRVVDISETGIRFIYPYPLMITKDVIRASLKFHDGVSISIAGKMVRRYGRQIALKLDEGIPYKRIMSEQLRLRRLELNGVISYAGDIRR